MVLINEDLAILFDNASEHASALGHKDVSTIHFLWALYSADQAEIPAAETVTSQLSEFGHVDKETVIDKIEIELAAMEVSTSDAPGKVPTSTELQQILEISVSIYLFLVMIAEFIPSFVSSLSLLILDINN